MNYKENTRPIVSVRELFLLNLFLRIDSQRRIKNKKIGTRVIVTHVRVSLCYMYACHCDTCPRVIVSHVHMSRVSL